MMLKVIELEKNRDEKDNTFPALMHIILIECRIKKTGKLLEHIQMILVRMRDVSQNQQGESINKIINQVS